MEFEHLRMMERKVPDQSQIEWAYLSEAWTAVVVVLSWS